MMSYTLSCVIDAHSNDVRCVTPFSSGAKEEVGLFSGSRDATVRLWTAPASGADVGQWKMRTLFKGHPTYVSSVCYKTPDDTFKHVCIKTKYPVLTP